MLVLVYAIASLIPVVVAARHAFRREGIVVDPVLTFSAGFLFYWLLPIFIGTTGAFADQPGMDLWYSVFRGVAPSTLGLFVLTATSAYVAFVAGYTLHPRPLPRDAAATLTFEPAFLWPIFLLLVGSALVFGFILRDQFFHGYYTDTIIGKGGGIRGSFVAASVALLVVAFLSFSQRALRDPTLSLGRSVRRDPFFITYFVAATLAVSLGGRLYMVSTFFMLAAYHSVFKAPVRYRTAAFGVLAIAALAGVIGMLRLGAHVTVLGMLFNLAAEPVFTSFSLVTFLSQGRTELLRAPVFLAGDFVNLVPTFLLPGKGALLVNPEDYGFRLFAPIGALNSFFSFMINFGIVGTVIVLYLCGSAVAWLQSHARHSAVGRTSFAMITGWITFTFFRDPFAISIVKNIIEFSLIIPAVFAAAANVLTMASGLPLPSVRDAKRAHA